MNYPYSEDNRFDAPLSYMYTPYSGVDFLIAYINDRRSRLAHHLQIASTPLSGGVEDALLSEARILASTKLPDAFSVNEQTPLQPLLRSLLGVLATQDHVSARSWLVRIIQRFEVSKKLYTSYAPGFRKGEGDVRNPALYIELALCLALAYFLSGQLQYLSTLLKLNDLLLSLETDILFLTCPPNRIEALVSAELDAVTALAAAQGFTIDV